MHDFERLSYNVIGACIEVQKQLGVHCMEVDYQRALALALSKKGISHVREVEIPVCFDGIEVSRRRVDFVVWDDAHQLLLEIKASNEIKPEDVEQVLLYLRNGNFAVGLLINFGQYPLGKRRFVHSPTGPALFAFGR